jgi:hypothetical protein
MLLTNSVNLPGIDAGRPHVLITTTHLKWLHPSTTLCRAARWLISCDPAHRFTQLQAFNGGFHPGTTEKNNMSLNADGCGVGW